MGKVDVYQMVTDRIIESLEQGKIPWNKPWVTANPQNGKTRREYNGINILLLALGDNAETPFYMTFKQIQELGGKVKKGEKSTPIVYWSMFKTTDDEGNAKTIPFLKYFNVFNVSQTEGIPEDKIPTIDQIQEFNENLMIEEFVNNANLPEIYGSQQAAYSPSEDKLFMPKREQFKSEEEYYCTLFHEAVHSTGHKSRLDRDFKRTRDAYAYEELVAELGASFLCNHFGIERTFENTTAYIQSWIKHLKNDKKMIISAASKAQKAVEFLLGKLEDPTEA